jgi:ferredoxin
MGTRLKKQCASCIVAEKAGGSLFGCNKQDRVVRQLDMLTRENRPQQENAIEEQIRQCPEAFKVGEIMEKLFNQAKHGFEDNADQDRCLPPPEAIIPPFA